MKGKICVFFVYKLENKDIFCDNFDGVFFSLCAWLNSPELMIPSLLKGLERGRMKIAMKNNTSTI